MSSRSVILFLATVLIPACALTFVGIVLVRQQGELIDRRAEDQGRLLARDVADSLDSLLHRRMAAVAPDAVERYPAGNGILNLGRLEHGVFRSPFPRVQSTFSDPGFVATLRQIPSSQAAYRRAAVQNSHPDQRAFLLIREAVVSGQASDDVLDVVRSQDQFTDEFGIPLSLYAMEATGRIDSTFSPARWLNREALNYALDLGVAGDLEQEHEALNYVAQRYAGIEGWRLTPDSVWLVTRVGDAYLGARMDSVRVWARDIEGLVSLSTDPIEGGRNLAPVYPFLSAKLVGVPTTSSPALWIVALVLVVMVTTFSSLLLFRDARRERRLADLRATFVSSVSHEVRTPLAAIRLYTDSLLAYGPGSDDEWRQDLETISYETDRLTRMLDNVLRVSRIERGTDRYHRREGMLDAPVRKALDAIMPSLKESGCTVTTDIRPVPAHFDGDAVEQAVVNLLSNAAKYAPRSAVHVACMEAEGSGIVRVADSGPGLSADVAHRVFEPYFRSNQDAAPAQTGTGLGLSLVRHIARGHDGDVELVTSPGHGCTFTLTIPLNA